MLPKAEPNIPVPFRTVLPMINDIAEVRSPDLLPSPSSFQGFEDAAAIILVDTLPLRRRSPMTRASLGKGHLTTPVSGGAHGSPRANLVQLVPGGRWRRKWMTQLDHDCAGLPFHEVMRDDVAQLLHESTTLIALNTGLWTLLPTSRPRIPRTSAKTD